MESADDQSINDKSVRALLTNYRESRPLVLLVDDKYALFPIDLGADDVTYAVLGFYTIAHFWGRYRSDSHYSIAPSQMSNFKRNIIQPTMNGGVSFGTSLRSSGVMARWISCICLEHVLNNFRANLGGSRVRSCADGHMFPKFKHRNSQGVKKQPSSSSSASSRITSLRSDSRIAPGSIVISFLVDVLT